MQRGFVAYANWEMKRESYKKGSVTTGTTGMAETELVELQLRKALEDADGAALRNSRF